MVKITILFLEVVTFNIPSDPELESQINDKVSIEKILGFPSDMAFYDHSTFSRFRSRLSKKAIIKLKNEIS